MLKIGTSIVYIWQPNTFSLSVWSAIRFVFRLFDFDSGQELILLSSLSLKDILFYSSIDYRVTSRLGLMLISLAFEIFFFYQA